MASTNYEMKLSCDGKTLEGIAGIRPPGDGPVDVVIPDGVMKIEDEAFAECRNLCEIRMNPVKGRFIADNAFSGCPGWKGELSNLKGNNP